MRKTQVALAALALVASTAALADVTVYGNIDASIVSTSGSTGFAGAGNNLPTLFGLKGAEDLGSGLKAGFNLEAGLNAATGSYGANGGVATSLFNRAANVSVGTDAATITVGTVISPYISGVLPGANTVGGAAIYVPGLLRIGGGSLANVGVQSAAAAGDKNGGFFIPETVNLSLNGGGFSANLQHRVTSGAYNSSYSAANLSTSLAGVNLSLAYQDIGATTSGTNLVSAQKTTAIAANTEVAGVRLAGIYSNNNNSLGNGYMLSASMPLTAGLSGVVAYADNSKQTSLGRQTSVGLQYDMSKRTSLYGTYNSFSVSNAVLGNSQAISQSGKSAFIVGVAHAF